MTIEDVSARVLARAAATRTAVPPALARSLATYLDILGRWNLKINLTALDVSSVDDAAVDRLILEPLRATEYLRPDDRAVLDVGSGSGSPAFPMKLAVPRLRFTLVESRARKAAFLRACARQLDLVGVDVENRRLEDLPAPGVTADVATVRGVKVNEDFVRCLKVLVRPGGRVFLFTNAAQAVDLELGPAEIHDLLPGLRSRLAIFTLGGGRSAGWL